MIIAVVLLSLAVVFLVWRMVGMVRALKLAIVALQDSGKEVAHWYGLYAAMRDLAAVPVAAPVAAPVALAPQHPRFLSVPFIATDGTITFMQFATGSPSARALAIAAITIGLRGQEVRA